VILYPLQKFTYQEVKQYGPEVQVDWLFVGCNVLPDIFRTGGRCSKEMMHPSRLVCGIFIKPFS
jgi:hypothetical protein